MTLEKKTHFPFILLKECNLRVDKIPYLWGKWITLVFPLVLGMEYEPLMIL